MTIARHSVPDRTALGPSRVTDSTHRIPELKARTPLTLQPARRPLRPVDRSTVVPPTGSLLRAHPMVSRPGGSLPQQGRADNSGLLGDSSLHPTDRPQRVHPRGSIPLPAIITDRLRSPNAPGR